MALESLRRVRGLSLEQALEQEYRVGLRFLAGPDFREGIRAQVVDKDRNPHWKPATLAEVSRDGRRGLFRPAGRARTEALSEGEEHGRRTRR